MLCLNWIFFKFSSTMISGASNENLPNNEWFEYDDNSSFQSGVDQSAVQALMEQQGPNKPKVTVQRLATSYMTQEPYVHVQYMSKNKYRLKCI